MGYLRKSQTLTLKEYEISFQRRKEYCFQGRNTDYSKTTLAKRRGKVAPTQSPKNQLIYGELLATRAPNRAGSAAKETLKARIMRGQLCTKRNTCFTTLD